jgi:hypothetical protein
MIEIYINNQKIDFNETLNIKNQSFDIYDFSLGSVINSYTLEASLTDSNKKIFSFLDNPVAKQTAKLTGKIYADGLQILSGNVRILNIQKTKIRFIIQGSSWIDKLNGIYIDEVFTSSDNHTFNYTNMSASWSGSGNNYRYPFINFGKTVRGSNNFDLVNFVPMWKIGYIITRIFEAAKVNLNTSSWIVSTGGQDMYVLAPCKTRVASDFGTDKTFAQRVTNLTDNQVSGSHPTLTTITVTLNKTNVDFDTNISGNATAWNNTNDSYTIPASGTYRFVLKVAVKCGHDSLGSFSSIVRTVTASIVSSSLGTVATLFKNSGMTFDGSLCLTLDSGYISLDSGDAISVTLNITSQAYNAGTTRTVTMETDASNANMEISAITDTWCLYPGEFFVQNPSKYLPHITAIDFIRGIKEAFGLVFWYDLLSNSVHCNPLNTYLGQTIIDYSNKQDYQDDTDLEIIASNYKKNISLRLKPDTSDIIYNNEVSNVGIPAKKDIVLASLSAQEGTDIVENSLLSPTPLFKYGVAGMYFLVPPAIHGATLNPDYRPFDWNIRLMKWIGETSGTTHYIYSHYYDVTPVTRTVYAKSEAASMVDNYLFFSKYYYSIDNGKFIEVSVIMTPSEFLKFQSVLTTAANEGFRACYKLNINGSDGMYYVTSIVFDGKRAKLSLIQK